jgi:hypothetical protein
MKTNVAETSLRAYRELRDADELPAMERLVYYALALHGPMTREQIAAKTGMKEGSACGRVNKLMERSVVVHAGYLVNPKTGKANEVVDLIEAHKCRYWQGKPEVMVCA